MFEEIDIKQPFLALISKQIRSVFLQDMKIADILLLPGERVCILFFYGVTNLMHSCTSAGII